MQKFKRWVINVAAFFLIISAALVNSQSLYYMSALLLMLPVISYALGSFTLRDIDFQRVIPGTAWEGQEIDLQLRVSSKSRVPRLFLEIVDELPPGLEYPSIERIHFNAMPSTVSVVSYSIRVAKRGEYDLSSFRIVAVDPLGLYSFSKRFSSDSKLIAYPVPPTLPELNLSGAERYGFRDLPLTAAKGSGVDPDGVREYVPGDPLRRIHWKSFARTGQLNVIEFEESRAVNVAMAIDLTFGSDVGEGLQTSLEYLVHAAAGVAQSAINHGSSVRLIAMDRADRAQTAGRGVEHLYDILSSLAYAEATENYSFAETLPSRLGIVAPGTSLIILTSRTSNDLCDAVQYFAGAGVQTTVFLADTGSFDPARKIGSNEMNEFLENLVSVGITPFVIRKNDARQVRLEALTNSIRV